MHTKTSFLRQLSLLILVGFLLTACDDKKPIDKVSSEPQEHLAKLLKVSTKKNDTFLNYPATIKSQKLSILSFEVSGKVKEILVKEAKIVKKGEVLARLDSQDFKVKIESARSKFNNAKSEYQRALRLIQGNATSQSNVDAKKSKRDVAKSTLLIAEKALENSILKAPHDGIISLVSIKKQEVIQGGKDAIHIFDFRAMKAIVDVPASIIAQSGKEPEEATNSYIVLDAASKQQIPIVYSAASLEADSESQTYAVTFTFDAPEGLVILPGMSATVWFPHPAKSANTSRISIPLTAIATDGEQKYVWVVDVHTMKVSKKNVTVKADVGTGIIITSGLASGEIIVTAGISFLSEGMKVRAWSK